MYGILLIGVLAITGGAVAFIGDRLGTKIGKKRLSIFGLRPRHTSIVVTILTGMLITVLTFGVMAAISENVRTALFGMEQLNRSMEKIKNDLAAASKELSFAQEEQKRAADELEKSKNEIEKLEDEQQKLEEESEKLKEGNRLLEVEKESLMRRNDELADDNAALGEKNAALDNENAALAKSNETLAERAKNLRDGLVAIREGDIVYRAGEVIASGVIMGGRDKDEVAGDIAQLVDVASRNVGERLGSAQEGGDIWIYQPEYDAAIERIADSDKDMVVRITSAGNLVRGEPVHTSLELYENSIIYRKDEFIIAKTYIVTNLSGGEAEDLLMNFLQDVNSAAAAKGILKDPIRGSVGIMEGEQFYDLVEALMPIKNKAIILSAYARDATDALGPLRLNIKLEGIDER